MSTAVCSSPVAGEVGVNGAGRRKFRLPPGEGKSPSLTLPRERGRKNYAASAASRLPFSTAASMVPTM